MKEKPWETEAPIDAARQEKRGFHYEKNLQNRR